MDCSCIRGEGFDFSIRNPECSYIAYDDMSDWMTDTNYLIPSAYMISIKNPNSTGFIDVEVSTEKTNKITAAELGISSECLIDGIYCLKTEDICGINYTRFFAITYKLDCCFSQLLLQAETEEDWQWLRDTRNRIDQIHEAAKMKNERLAINLYTKVRRDLSRKNCNC